MAATGGSRAQVRKWDTIAPEIAAPTRKADHKLASTPARRRFESGWPCESVRNLRPAANASWPAILFSVPVIKVRLTDSAPILDRAGFIMPIARLSVAISK